MNFAGIFGEILGCVIGLYIVLNILSWHLPVITSSWSLYVPFATAAIVLAMILRLCMYAIPLYRIQKIFETGANLVAIVALYMLIVIFPFDFGDIGLYWANFWVRLALIIALIGTGIATIVSFSRIFVGGKE